MSQLVRAGELRPEKATRSASVKTPEPIALLPLSEFALEGTRTVPLPPMGWQGVRKGGLSSI